MTQNPAVPASPDGVSLFDIIEIVAANLRLLVLGPLLAGVCALIVCFLVTPKFTAVTRFLPPQQQQSAAASMLQSLGALSGIASAASGIKDPADQYVAFLQSESVEDALIERFKLKERYGKDFARDARLALEHNSNIAASKDNIIKVEFDDRDPQFAAAVANAYVEELGHLLDRLAVTEAQQRRLFFEKQLEQANRNLIKAEQALAASGVSASALNANPSAALEGPARLRAEVVAQEVKLASMRSYLTTAAPEYQQAQAQLEALKDQLAEAEKQQPAGGKSDYIAKYREFKYQETLFEMFSKQYEMAKLDESREGAVIQVVDHAKVPERKSKPKKALIAAGVTVIVFLVLLTYVLLRHSVRIALREPAFAARLDGIRVALRKSLGRRV